MDAGKPPTEEEPTRRSAVALTRSASFPTGTRSSASQAPTWPSGTTNGPKAAANVHVRAQALGTTTEGVIGEQTPQAVAARPGHDEGSS